MLENKAKVDNNKLQQPTTKAIFEQAIKNRFEQLGKLPEDLDEAHASINRNIRDITLSVIGKKSYTRING